MSFESTYQLISPIGESPDALSYRAVMKMTGEEVWIHIIRPDSAAVFELARRQFSARSFGDTPILEVRQEGVKSYVVTRPLPPGATLVDWLNSLGHARTPDPLTQAGAFQYTGFAPPPPPMAATQEMPIYGKLPEQPPVPVPIPSVAVDPIATAAQPPPTDGFTRMFQAPQAPGAPPPAPTLAPAPSQSKQEPGEFTRMFQSPLMDHTPAPINPITNPVAPPPSQQVGEFTRMFKAINAPSVMAVSSPSPGAPVAGPGDFTRLLQTPPAGSMSKPTVAPPPFGGGTVPSSAMPGSMSSAPQSGMPSAMPQAPPAHLNTPQASPFAPPPSLYNPAPQSAGQPMPPASAPGASGSSSPFNRSPIGAPSYAAPSVSMSGIGAPSISSSGEIHGPHIGMPSFSAGHISAPSLYSGGSFSLDDLPGFGPGSSGQPANVAAPAAGPLSASNAPMNPNALSSGDGATSFFKAQPHPLRPAAAQPPAQAGPGDYTRMMQAPPAASAPAVGVPLPKSNAPPPAPAPLFSQPVVPTAVPVPPTVPHPPPAAPGGFLKGISPWLIVGNVVILLMIVALIYVVVRSSH